MTVHRRGFVAALGLGLAVAPLAHAQFTVFDPSNYAQNVLTAARTLESVNNQIRSLQNEAEMLIGQARSLANLPFSSLAALQAQLAETRRLLSEAQGIAYDVAQIQTSFRQSYAPPTGPVDGATLSARADARWDAAVAGLQTVGIILVVAMLVTPGATAHLLTDRFDRMTWIAVGSAMLSSVIGIYWSYWMDASTGGCIVVVQTLLFLISFLFAPRHGLVAQLRQ